MDLLSFGERGTRVVFTGSHGPSERKVKQKVNGNWKIQSQSSRVTFAFLLGFFYAPFQFLKSFSYKQDSCTCSRSWCSLLKEVVFVYHTVKAIFIIQFIISHHPYYSFIPYFINQSPQRWCFCFCCIKLIVMFPDYGSQKHLSCTLIALLRVRSNLPQTHQFC